jgi:hypothetical protein
MVDWTRLFGAKENTGPLAIAGAAKRQAIIGIALMVIFFIICYP